MQRSILGATRSGAALQWITGIGLLHNLSPEQVGRFLAVASSARSDRCAAAKSVGGLVGAAMLPSARVLHPRSHRHGSGIPVRWLYTRVAPSHAVQLSAVYLDRNVEEILAGP
jgi:hypothetical protein